MAITLEQARTLAALDRFGSFAKAAEYLKKGHTAVVYTLKSMEEATGADLLDRSGYRTSLTPIGMRVLEQCRKMLTVEEELNNLCQMAKSGWEPHLTVIFDGILPVEGIVTCINKVAEKSPLTKVSLLTEFLGDVEHRFDEKKADIMITLLPVAHHDLNEAALPMLRAHLVCQRDHPLTKINEATSQDLEKYPLVTVRGSDERLQLSTSHLETNCQIKLGDFYAKKISLLKGIGFGWLPDYMISKELESGDLVEVRWNHASVHEFHPKVLYRRSENEGKALGVFLDCLRINRELSWSN